jgi:hypothetical protein
VLPFAQATWGKIVWHGVLPIDKDDHPTEDGEYNGAERNQVGSRCASPSSRGFVRACQVEDHNCRIEPTSCHPSTLGIGARRRRAVRN